LLEGKNVNLRIVEKEDLPLAAEWTNSPDFLGEYNPLRQVSKADIQKMYDNPSAQGGYFFIEKKDGTKIGYVQHFPAAGNLAEIGYALTLNERRKGYCTEAVNIMIDYLFLSKNMMRVQAHTDVRNVGSQKVLEKTGFKKEGVIRKSFFTRGEWRDMILYSILREEWKEPKILTRTEKK
jgi:RimJ/RimL family protein N-acetyltransferase